MKRLKTANFTTNEKIEQLIDIYSNTTIRDELFGPMNNFEQIKREFSELGVNINSTIDSTETEIIKLEDGWLTVDINPRKHSTWIAIDIYDEDDCPIDYENDREIIEEEEYCDEEDN